MPTVPDAAYGSLMFGSNARTFELADGTAIG